MGSIAGIVLREANGQIHITSGTAADISWFVNNIRLVNKHSDHIRRFLTQYDFSGDDHQDLRPIGNGLVVVDMVEDRILRYQNVTAVGYFNGINVTEAARSLIEESGGDPDAPQNIRAAYTARGEGADEYACVRFHEFLIGDRVKEAYRGTDPVPISKRRSMEEIDAELRQGIVRCELDMIPFSITEYAALTVQGARDLRHDLQELAFPIENSRLWDDWIEVYASK